jgi:hypothetical protein
LNPDQYLDQNSYQEKKVVFPVDLVLSRDLQILYPILGSNTVTVTFFCDALVNPANTLKTRVDKAKTTLSTLGTEVFKSKNPIMIGSNADKARLKG